MRRFLQPEWLDALPAGAPEAQRSRLDLRRINAWMGSVRLMTACLTEAARHRAPRRIVDFGAGDGTLLLRLTQQLPMLAAGTELVLVDRSPAVDELVLAQMQACGHSPRVEQADARRWLQAMPAEAGTWAVANLFLHHFSQDDLRAVFSVLADKADLCCACEPRRAVSSLLASRLLWLIGANAVTRHDALVSVRAGFRGRELSAHWPANGNWRVTEYWGAPFSHLFLAERKTVARLYRP